MSPEANPAPPAAPGKKKRLRREIVLSAALALVDAEGLDALTMRRLGQLGQGSHGPVPLRRKPRGTAQADVELVLNELAIFPDDPDWQAQLRRIAHDLRLLALRHPNVVPLLVTRPLSTPSGLGHWGHCGRWSRSCPC